MNIPYLKTVSAKLLSVSFDFSTVPSIVFKAILTAVMGLAGIKIYLVSVFGLVILDVITGVMASIKKGEAFKSKILKKGLIDKTFLYIVMLIAVFILEGLAKSVINYTPYYFVFLASFMISCYELISIGENVFVLNPDLSFLKPLISLVGKLQDQAISTAQKTISDTDVSKLIKKNESKTEDTDKS
jgi:hypothetical protein